MGKENSSSKSRTRNWTVIIYPESAPENWRDILNSYHIEWVESPLHDKDLDATGEVKKPHWHVLLLFPGNKTYEQILDLVEPIKSTIPQKCHNARALVRYMAHLDNPDKMQYKKSDIIAHGGIDLAELLKLPASQRYTIIAEMIEYIKTNNIIEIQDLIDFSITDHYDDWFPLLCDNSMFVVSGYIKSQRHRQSNYKKIDFETGEIID